MTSRFERKNTSYFWGFFVANLRNSRISFSWLLGGICASNLPFFNSSKVRPDFGWAFLGFGLSSSGDMDYADNEHPFVTEPPLAEQGKTLYLKSVNRCYLREVCDNRQQILAIVPKILFCVDSPD